MTALRKMNILESLMGAVLVLASPKVDAQTVTSIVPDPQAATATQTSVTFSGGLIEITGETQLGGNLFHSFSEFTLNVSDQVSWVPLAGQVETVDFIINRINGGAPSVIDGVLESQFPGADLVFINPNGIVLGEGAEVNVPGQARFATANHVVHADGTAVTAQPGGPSILTSAPPEAFGFLGAAAPLDVNGAQLVSGTGIQLAGGNVSISNSGLLVDPSLIANGDETAARGLDIVAAGPGELVLPFDGQEPVVGASGQLVIDGGSRVEAFDAAASDGHSIRVTGGALAVDSSRIEARAINTDAAGDILIAADSFALDGGELVSRSFGTGRTGDIRLLVSGDVAIRDRGGDRAAIVHEAGLSGATTPPGGTGVIEIVSGGDLLVSSGSTFVNDGEEIAAAAGPLAQPPAQIVITVDGTLTMQGASITTESSAVQSGDKALDGAGDITISAGSLVFETGPNAGPDTQFPATITTQSLSGEPAGNITIRSNGDISGFAEVTSSAGRPLDSVLEASRVPVGAGGDILVDANGSINLTGGGIRAQIVPVLPLDAGAGRDFSALDIVSPGAGAILVRATGAITLDGTVVTSNTAASNPVPEQGAVRIEAATITLNGAAVSSNTSAGQQAGTVALDAGEINLLAGAIVSSNASSAGQTGQVAIQTEVLSVRGGSEIATESGAGDGGRIFVDASEISLTDATINTNAPLGSAGAIVLSVADGGILTLTNARITTSSDIGSGGVIEISRPAAIVLEGSSILALGDVGGANARIDSDFWISSADAPSRVAIDGVLVVDSIFQDVTSGAQEEVDESIGAIDILEGRCRTERFLGETSTLGVIATGPFSAPSSARRPPCDPAKSEFDDMSYVSGRSVADEGE